MSLTVQLPDDAGARLQAEAHRRRITVGELVAELAQQFDPERPAGRHLSFIGLGSSSSGRFARNTEELLEEGFGR